MYALIEVKSDVLCDGIAVDGERSQIESLFKAMCESAFDFEDEYDEDEDWDDDFDDDEDDDEDDEAWEDFCEDYYGDEYEKVLSAYSADGIVFPADLGGFSEWKRGVSVSIAVAAESFNEFLQKINKTFIYKVPLDSVESKEFFKLLNADLSDIYAGIRCRQLIMKRGEK